MLSHTWLNEYLIPGVFIIYLLNLRARKYDPFFDLLYKVLIASIPVYTILYLIGLNPFLLFKYSWSTWTTPTQYLVFILIIYQELYRKTKDQPYAITLSLHMALSTGYLYEIPRYLALQGPSRLIRFNKDGPFFVHYAIISLIVIAWLLVRKGFRTNKKTFLGSVNYLSYIAVYYFYYESLRTTWLWLYFLGFETPWIPLCRLPTMFLFYTITSGIDSKP